LHVRQTGDLACQTDHLQLVATVAIYYFIVISGPVVGLKNTIDKNVEAGWKVHIYTYEYNVHCIVLYGDI